jgi:4-hydroxy-3-methylbut-2-enyl diphosphate reductase
VSGRLQIIRADHLGMCFGVRDAIQLAVHHAGAAPLTILGDLVHNESVLAGLRAKGIAMAPDAAHAATKRVMITAHGASNRVLAETRARGLDVVEATCPLVHVAHRAVASLVLQGYHPVIIGQRSHVEVRGLTGDLDAFDVVLDEPDVFALAEHPRIGVAAQTTQPMARVRELVALIRRRFPRSDVRFVDTVCLPTKQRQDAAVDLARRCDVVVVIGGAHSNNTRELVAVCRRHCPDVHHVQTESDLQQDWFGAANVVGITAGTSTPDDIIDRVECRLREMARERAAEERSGAQGPPRATEPGCGAEPHVK